MKAHEVIDLLGLQPLEGEGGYFRETYRSCETVAGDALPDRYRSDRRFSTAIFYLLTPDAPSLLHRVRSDEIFHFYLGDPVTMLQLHGGGSSEIITIGSNIMAGERPQVVVPAGVCQGAFLNDGGKETPPKRLYPSREGGWALMGTTVAPGFEFDDFELADRKMLLRNYPQQAELIRRLTKA